MFDRTNMSKPSTMLIVHKITQQRALNTNEWHIWCNLTAESLDHSEQVASQGSSWKLLVLKPDKAQLNNRNQVCGSVAETGVAAGLYRTN